MQDLDEMYREYYGDVYRYLRGLTADEQLAEDLTQETFLRAMRSVKGFRGDCAFRVWLCQIAKNLWYSHCRKARHTADLSEAETVPDELHLAELIADKDVAMQLHHRLHTLRDPYKEVFMLRVFGELGFEAIGEIFGHTAHWACVTYHRAAAMLRDTMKEDA